MSSSPLLSLDQPVPHCDELELAVVHGAALGQALVKLYSRNVATLTADAMHSAFYGSHPPPSVRVARLPARR